MGWTGVQYALKGAPDCIQIACRLHTDCIQLRMYESHIFELRIKTWMKVILAVMSTTWAVVKIRPEKNSGLYGIWTHDLWDTGAALYQLLKSQLGVGHYEKRPYFHHCSTARSLKVGGMIRVSVCSERSSRSHTDCWAIGDTASSEKSSRSLTVCCSMHATMTQSGKQRFDSWCT